MEGVEEEVVIKMVVIEIRVFSKVVIMVVIVVVIKVAVVIVVFRYLRI